MKNLSLSFFNTKLIAVLIFSFFNLYALYSQNAADYIFSAEITAYTPITGGTVVSNDPTHDHEFFAGENIAFDFEYLGAAYSQLGISTNGYVKFGGAASTASYAIFDDIPNSLAGFSGDLAAQASAELRMETIGIAPNRICVIQWNNYRWLGQAGSYNFQIRLHETSNKITYHYGLFSHLGADQILDVGIIGTDNTDILSRTLTETAKWNTTNTVNTNNPITGILIETDREPTDGLAFNFSTPPADLNLSYAINTSDPCKGETLEYTVEVTNNGPNDTYNAEVLSEIPTGLTFVNATASQGTYNSVTGIWDIGTINNGNSASLVISASVNNDQGGLTINSTAVITNSFAEDPDLTNNSSSLGVTVSNNTLPEIGAIADQAVVYNQTSTPVNFTVSDIETNSDDLILSVNSSNPTVIPESGITFSGTGDNKSFTITPGLNQFGTSTVTIEVSDGECSSTSTFFVEVFKQSYANFERAKFVVGQVDFSTTSTTASDVTAPGSNSSAVSAKGVLAVGSQTTNRVLLWNSVPTANGEAADVVIGQADFTSTGTGTSATQLRNPDGVNFSPDGNKLIVADAGNNRILIWNSIPTTNNQPADVVLGQSNFTNNGFGLSANQFNRPTDVQITSNGKMIVTDRNNSRVLIFNKIPTTNFVDADLVIGQPDFITNTPLTTQDGLDIPWNTAIAPDGKLLIADDGNNRILIYNSIPTVNGALADNVIGQINFTDFASGSSADKMDQPGVTVSPSGIIAIADYGNHRVLVFNEIPTSNGASADIVLGQADFTENVSFNDGSGSGIAGTPDDRNISQPYGINYDLNERLFVNGRNMHRMMVFGETPNQESDLALSFDTDNASPCINSLVSFTVNVTNNGPDNATNISVISALPVGFTLKEAISDIGTYNQSSGYWTIPFIGNGETVSLEMRGTVDTGQNDNSITAYASLRSYNQADSDFSNNAGSITVNVADNETPSINPIDDVITDINTSTPAINISIADLESAAGDLIVSAVSSNTTIIPNANLTLGGTGASRNITIEPANNQTGPVIITVTVDDGTCTTKETFEVSVGNVWLGNTNDWNNASNWSTSLPSSSIGAIIPASPLGGNYPVINADASVNNLGINAGAQLTLNATRTLDIYGDFYNDGSESTGSGILNISGTTVQNIRGITGGLNISNVSGVALSGDLSVMEVLDLTDGMLTVGANTLTIQNPLAGNNANLQTVATSSITVEGSTTGITLPAQVNQLTNLTLDNGSGLTLNANITLENLVLSSGSLRLNGNDMIINGSINSTAGLLSGNINSNLTVNGTGDAGTLQISTTDNVFNNFEINRTAGELSIQNDIIIEGILSLTNGVITTNDMVWVENTDPNAISIFNNNSYINGLLRRCVTAGQSYDFPVGSLNYLENAAITFNSISAITCIDAVFKPGLTGSAPNGLTVGSNEVTGVLDHGFWTIEPTNPSVTIEYDISLTSIGHTNGEATDHHVLLKRDTDAHDWMIDGDYSSANAGGSNTNPITVSRTGLNSFSDFSIGVSTEGPLPINLLYFTGELKMNHTKLSWETASEINNDYFEIQKSDNGKNFKKIGVIEGNGTTNSSSKYSYSDYDINSEKTFYRFKQVDYDGQHSYSPVVHINFQKKNEQLVLVPNPAQNHVRILIGNGDILSCRVAIYDQLSKLIVQESFNIQDNPEVRLDISQLAIGVYYIKTVYQTATGSIIGSAKLVKQ